MAYTEINETIVNFTKYLSSTDLFEPVAYHYDIPIYRHTHYNSPFMLLCMILFVYVYMLYHINFEQPYRERRTQYWTYKHHINRLKDEYERIEEKINKLKTELKNMDKICKYIGYNRKSMELETLYEKRNDLCKRIFETSLLINTIVSDLTNNRYHHI